MSQLALKLLIRFWYLVRCPIVIVMAVMLAGCFIDVPFVPGI